jgi:hypothetical protein
MGLLDRLLLRQGSLNAARRAELSGDLVRAIELWAEAGEQDEVARVMILRGDSEPDPEKRLQHFTQAARSATPKSGVARQARAKRATLVVALAADGSVSSAARRDVLEAARELEDLGESEAAADAYALARDADGEARALAQAGQVERLETLLDAEQDKRSEARQRTDTYGEIETLIATGRRREALALAGGLALTTPLDGSARERIQAIEARRLSGAVCHLLLQGRPVRLALSDDLVIGRTEGDVRVPSAAISRVHIAIARAGAGAIVRDLASRNGTTLRGLRLAGDLPVGAGLSLLLGGEVRLEVTPSAAMPGAVDVDVGGERYVASLGAAALGVGAWRLERTTDGWVELDTSGGPTAFRGDIAMGPRTTLLVGDRLSRTRGGSAVLEIVGAG